MKTKLLIVLILTCFSSFAQYTLIPDVKFENKLISLGLDSGTADGKVLTSNINTIPFLSVNNSSISDLTGIQDFVALTSLDCYSNKLTSLDVSKNTALTTLRCQNNLLSSLDVSKNTALTLLYCRSNQLSSLDVSKNTKLTHFICDSNQLTTLNLKNGNYSNFDIQYLNLRLNPNLGCIQVDDAVYANANWLSGKDSFAYFSPYDCSTVIQIPDASFEDKLIDLGIDTDGKNGVVYTSSITSITSLNIANSSISNLTGIQGFGSLTTLDCSGNLLKKIDLSKNTALATLKCNNNPNLSCIQVADVAQANANWTTIKDGLASFNLDCTNYTLIPDSNFENKLIAAGIDRDGLNGKVDTERIAAVINLDVSNSNIADLSVIQYFTSLKTLDCYSNQLTSLDVSKNTALTSLKCHVNQLSSLDVSKNTALDYLSCTGNKLTNLDLSKNTALKYLDCSGNSFSNLDLSKNTLLTHLFWSGSYLANLDVSKNTALTNLNCSSNNLTKLDVSKNTALEYLQCGYNQLSSLDVSKNTALTILYCYNNSLTSLNLKNGNNSGINLLSFNNNPNLSCIQVDDVAYANAKWSGRKDATATYSTNCPSTYTLISSDFEDKLIALGIDTDGKNGSVLLADIANVKSIDVSNSGISNLSGIEYFTGLETLICSGNSLSTIDISKNTVLKYLDCSNNPLTTLDVSKNILLTELYCDGVVTITKKVTTATTTAQLTVLDLSNNVFLTKLSCSNNQIVNLDLSKNTLLTDVNCSKNALVGLNLNNGNNTKLVNINFKNNVSLSCIKVDDEVYSTANWAAAKDATTMYSKTTCILGVNDFAYNNIVLYPNPVKGQLYVDNIVLEKVTVYDVLGKLVKTTAFTTNSNSNTLDLVDLPKGIYYVYLQSQGISTVKKIIVD